MKLAIVIPIFNEQANLPELRGRLTAACDGISDVDWRVIYVDDGSRDESAPIIRAQQAEDPRFTLIQLSRNFGQMAAVSAGLLQAAADAVIVMDGDLQDPPEVIPELLAAWRNGGQVVLAQRRSRQERGLRRLGLEVFHRVFGWVSDFPVHVQTGIFGLLDRVAVEELTRLPEHNRFLPGLYSWIGFDQRIVFYDRQARRKGAPKQTIRRLVRYATDGMLSFSYKPLRLMTYCGVLVSLAGFGLAVYFIVKRLLGIETAQTGFTTLVTLILFLGGAQLIAIGLVGEYLVRVYDEAKRRPLYIIKRRSSDHPG